MRKKLWSFRLDFCVGALVRPKGFPGVRVGLRSFFPSVRLDLQSLALRGLLQEAQQMA